MINGTTMYWITRIIALNDSLCCLYATGVFVLITMSFGMLFAAGFGVVDVKDIKNFANKYFKPAAIITFLALFVNLWIPDKNDMVLIAGAELTKQASLTPEAAMLRQWVDGELQKQVKILNDNKDGKNDPH